MPAFGGPRRHLRGTTKAFLAASNWLDLGWKSATCAPFLTTHRFSLLYFATHSGEVQGGTSNVLAGDLTRRVKVKLTNALVGLAALGGAALSAGTATAMPIGLTTNAGLLNVEQVRLVCDGYGRCFRTGPRYYRYGGPVVRFGFSGHRHRGWHHGRRW